MWPLALSYFVFQETPVSSISGGRGTPRWKIEVNFDSVPRLVKIELQVQLLHICSALQFTKGFSPWYLILKERCDVGKGK